MKKFKHSKIIYDKNFFFKDKCYFVFTFFNLNSTMLDLLKRILENNFNFIIPKIQNKFNITNFYLEIDIEDYFTEKQELLDFFYEENFKFYHSAVFYKSNYIQPVFFENSFLLKQENNENTEEDEEIEDDDYYEIYDEILFFSFLKIINTIIFNKKIIFLFYNIFFQNKNLFLYKCLQFTKQLQN